MIDEEKMLNEMLSSVADELKSRTLTDAEEITQKIEALALEITNQKHRYDVAVTEAREFNQNISKLQHRQSIWQAALRELQK